MTLRYFQGFEPYASAAHFAQSANHAVGASGSIATATPRTGARYWNLNGTFLRMAFALSGNTVIVGIAVNWNGGSFGQGSRPIRLWCSGQSRSAIVLDQNSSGNLVLTRGIASENAGGGASGLGTVLWTGSDIEPSNTWTYYELKVLLSSSATGAVTLRRNKTVIATLSGVQTLQNAADVVNSLVVERANAGGPPFILDDIYVCDGAGSANNDFLGPVGVMQRLAATDAAVAWTRDSGASNWSRVSEVGADEDTSYVETAGLGNIDRYGSTSLPATVATVFGARVEYRARYLVSGAAETQGLIQSGGVDALGASDALSVSYQQFTGAIQETDPNTGAAWTPSAISNSSFGVKRTT